MINKTVKIVLVLASLASLTYFSASTSATSASTSVTVPSACSLSSTLTTPHTAIINNGTNKTDIGTTTFNIVCNDSEGFSLYAVGYSNEQHGNNKLLATVGNTLTPTNDIITGTATNGNTSNWSMKLSPNTNTPASIIVNNYNNYNLVPNKYTKVISSNSTTSNLTTNSNGISITSTYQTYISGTQPAGSYSGKVKYTFLHPASAEPNQEKDCSANRICYWPNANGLVVDSMGDQSISNAATSADLWATNFRRDGYGFAGWSDKFDWVLNENDENGNGTGPNEGYHIYGPNETIADTEVLDKIKTEGLSLYAIWIKAEDNLQGWNGCSVMNIGEVTALKDARDHNAYAVAKLKDGKCWMIENLRLDNTALENSTGTLAQGYAKYSAFGNFSGLANPETSGFSSTYSANSLYSNNGSNNTINIGAGYNPSYRMPRYNNQNTSSPVAEMTKFNTNVYSYGNYYTWSAVIADTSPYYKTNNRSVVGTSICPADWRLPQGGDDTNSVDSDFRKLSIAIIGYDTNGSWFGIAGRYDDGDGSTNGTEASNKLRIFPNNFIYSSSGEYGSVYGSYWSSTAEGTLQAYIFHLNNNLVSPGTDQLDKFRGASTRCMFGS